MNPFTLPLTLWRLQLDLLTLTATVPFVMAHRFAKAGTSWREPGFLADPEWRRMMREKAEAVGEANRHAAGWWLQAMAGPTSFQRHLAASRRALQPYTRRVNANAERLGRR